MGSDESRSPSPKEEMKASHLRVKEVPEKDSLSRIRPWIAYWDIRSECLPGKNTEQIPKLGTTTGEELEDMQGG